MIEWNCWECKEPMEAPDSLVGEAVQCPKCLTPNRVNADDSPLARGTNTNEPPPAVMPGPYFWGGQLLLVVGIIAWIAGLATSYSATPGAVLLVGGATLLGMGDIIRRLDRSTGDSP